MKLTDKYNPPFACLKSPFKYPDGTPIKNADVVQLKNGHVGFVFYDDRHETWTVRFYNPETKMVQVHTLKAFDNYEYIVKRLS